MKILFFHRWVGVHGGGTETHLLELAKRFSQIGHEVTIMTREGSRLHDLDPAITVIRISKNYHESDHSYNDWRVYWHTLLFMLKSFWLLMGLRFRGVHFDVLSVHFFVEAIVARWYRFIFKTPFVFVLEGYTPLEAKTAVFADARIAISRFEAKMYRRKAQVPSKLIYIGIDLPRFSKTYSKTVGIRKLYARKDELLFLTVCRLEPRKDLLVLLEAAERVKRIGKKVKFMIAGTGISEGEIRAEIKKRGLDKTVFLLGFVEDEVLPAYYQAADCFLLTSKEEWFGIVFIEAMASGLPVISTNVDACPEVVGEAGVFFDKGDSKTLAKIISNLDDKREILLKLGKKALIRARDFDWNQQIYKYEKVYLDLIKK